MVIALSVALVFAQDDGDSAVVGEVIVHGDLLIERAKKEVTRELKAEGFTDILKREDYVIYRNTEPWKGELRLYDDGWAVMTRQPVQFHPASVTDASNATAAQWLTCIWVPSCLSVRGQTYGKRKWMARKVDVLEKTEEKVAYWSDLVADKTVVERIHRLEPQLKKMWNEGIALDDPSRLLPTYRERRAELLRFWESRTDTQWGDRVRLAVESFIRDEVQYSDAPFTKEEVDAANATRHGERVLDLDSPWSEVSSGVQSGGL